MYCDTIPWAAMVEWVRKKSAEHKHSFSTLCLQAPDYKVISRSLKIPVRGEGLQGHHRQQQSHMASNSRDHALSLAQMNPAYVYFVRYFATLRKVVGIYFPMYTWNNHWSGWTLCL